MSQDARRDEEQSTQRRANLLNFTYVDTAQIVAKQLFKELLSNDEMYAMRVIPLRVEKSNILFGITTTTSQQTMRGLEQRFADSRVSFAIISETGYHEYMKMYDPPKQIVYQDISFSDAAQAESLEDAISKTLEQVRADDMLAYLVQQAHRLKASDIHLECQKESVRIRFRVDGVLHVIARLSKDKYRQLMSVVAIAADVSTGLDEAQAGHINKEFKLATGESVTVNLRVETVSSVHGMDVVMRLFNLEMELLSLDKLNLSERERVVVDDIISHPTGMVMVVGPTGSGKTTTMYSLINTLNSEERKIITLEDPVEYFLEGIVQVPVKGDQNASGFADKLRALLRLDPDIIMVGEIRDQDTAKTSLQAALTGHLVMSTFHASSAAAALTRMIDFIGLNPLFASAIHLIMAQRLIRRLDDSTKQPFQPDDATREHIQKVIDTLPPGVERPDISNLTLYNPGSSVDNPFGYTGQIPLREQLQMTPSVRELLRQSANKVTTDVIEELAIKDGMLTMLQDGMLKVIKGETTLEEVYRVVG